MIKPPTHIRRSPGRGITIIETMIVITGVAAALSLCAVTIQLLMRLNTDGHDRLTAASTLERIGRQFREDVHASEKAALEKPARAAEPAIRFKMPMDVMVTYTARGRQLARDETRGGKPVRHEAYILSPRSTPRFELRDEGKRRLVVLTVIPEKKPASTESPPPIEILAIEGKDRVGPIGKTEAKK
jgi:hypothetical protein